MEPGDFIAEQRLIDLVNRNDARNGTWPASRVLN